MNILTETIGDVTQKISTGKTPPTKEEKYFDGEIDWFTPGDFTKNILTDSKRKISQIAVDDKKATIFPENSVLISCIGDIGKVGLVKKPSSANQQITAITLDPKIDPLFFTLWCKSHKKSFELKSKSAVVPILNNAVLRTVQFNYPNNLDDQKRIAHLLGKVEGMIAQRKQHLQQLDELLKSVFLEMFGDPVRNEKGWEKKTAIDYADCIVPGRDKPKNFTGDIPWVTTNDLNHLAFTQKSNTNIGLTQEEIDEVRARVIPQGSVLLTCVGDLGICSLCAVNMVVNQQLHAFQVRNKMSNCFFMYALSFQKAYMYQFASKTTVPYMNKNICNKTPMISPPITLQNQFAAIVEKVESLKSRYQSSLANLENLYGVLSQKAFKGELDLSRVPMEEETR